MNLFFFLLPLAVVSAPPTAPDTLVVCPREFRAALAEWEVHRRAQGHVLSIVEPPQSAEQLSQVVRNVGQSGTLKYLVLIGDEPARYPENRAQQNRARRFNTTIPTNYLPAKVNVNWGSEPEIASDAPYGDLDSDGVPDLAVGRIPVHSADELAGVVRKVTSYEQQADHGPWEKCLNIVSGCGGFGAATDALVEAAGRQVIQQTVPSDFEIRHTCAPSIDDRSEDDFGVRARQQLNDGGLAWIYLGHGMPAELDGVLTPTGKRSILSSGDVPSLRCGPHNPLAVLIACYTGAMDAPHGCLAEDLLIAEQGPVAVIAATRVTMPYGNTVLGYELLKACFRDKPIVLGDALRLADERTLKPQANDQLRASLDAIAAGLSPAPVDLVNERREHVLMYHLIGDPLLRLRLPAVRVAQMTNAQATMK